MKTSVLSSSIALIIGLVIGSMLLNSNPTIAESGRISHYMTMAMLLIVSLILFAKEKENRRLKEELRKIKSWEN